MFNKCKQDILKDFKFKLNKMRENSFQITKKQYDYLLPIFGNVGSKKILSTLDRKIDKYFFIGNQESYLDLLNRCKYI